jgi:hypothetical protein
MNADGSNRPPCTCGTSSTARPESESTSPVHPSQPTRSPRAMPASRIVAWTTANRISAPVAAGSST